MSKRNQYPPARARSCRQICLFFALPAIGSRLLGGQWSRAASGASGSASNQPSASRQRSVRSFLSPPKPPLSSFVTCRTKPRRLNFTGLYNLPASLTLSTFLPHSRHAFLPCTPRHDSHLSHSRISKLREQRHPSSNHLHFAQIKQNSPQSCI